MVHGFLLKLFVFLYYTAEGVSVALRKPFAESESTLTKHCFPDTRVNTVFFGEVQLYFGGSAHSVFLVEVLYREQSGSSVWCLHRFLH